MTENVIGKKKLTKSFKDTGVLKRVNFEVRREKATGQQRTS